jgi:PAS domain S-box-containing protein
MGQDAHALLAPDRYLEDFRAAWPRFASDGEGAMVGKVAHLDGRRKGGGEFPIELSLSAVRLKGRWHGVAILRDITERVRVERQIREDEARFRGLVEQEIAGIYIIGADGKVAYLNPAFLRMLGYTSEEVIGRPLVDFVADEDKALVLGQFEAQIANETQQTEVGMALLRKDGDRVDVLSHSARAEHLGQPAVVGVLVDITKHRQDERSLKRLNRTLLTLSQANEALVRATSEPDLLQGMCRTLVEQGGYRMAWIGIPEHDEAKTVTPVAWAGEEVSYLEQAHVTWADDERGRGPTGLAIRTGIPQSSQRLAEDERMAPWREEALKRGFLSSASLPLKDGDEVFGALTLYSGEVDAFSDEELKPLEELANDLAYGMVALRVRADREATVRLWRTGLDQTISALASTTEKRDPYTAGHQNRVAQLAVAIARELKLPEDQVQGIRLAGTIHDVGKITIPSEILTKPGKLTPLEHQLIQTHAQAGYDMVKGVQFPWPIALAILQHHERLDGSGYPNGLKGDEIIREAKILAVADVVEAMMSHRPYRQALGLDAALDEVQKAKGRLYDPEAVDACVRVFRERGLTLT